jgi:hypothetical protein
VRGGTLVRQRHGRGATGGGRHLPSWPAAWGSMLTPGR